MLKHLQSTTDRFLTTLICIVFMMTTALVFVPVPSVYAATSMENRYDKLSDARPSAIATHLIGFTYTDFAVPVGSIFFEFCSNSPLPSTPCTAPTGMDVSAGNFTSQAGETGFSVFSQTANTIILSRPAAVPVTGVSTYQFSNMLSPSTTGTYFMRMQTFTSTDATGVSVQEGGLVLWTSSEITVSTEVPEFLQFCAGVVITSFDCSSVNSYFIDLGELSKTETRTASSQLVAASNAPTGYSITVSGTTFTSGNNTIPAPSTPTASQAGTSQFGINLRDNSSPDMGQDVQGPGLATVAPNYANPNQFMYQNGDSIASGVVSQDWRKYTVSYIVNIGSGQPAGVYATTITYICLANF